MPASWGRAIPCSAVTAAVASRNLMHSARSLADAYAAGVYCSFASAAPCPGVDGVLGQVGEDCVVGLPAVGNLGGGSGVYGVVGGVGVEEFGDAGAGHDDAGVPVA